MSDLPETVKLASSLAAPATITSTGLVSEKQQAALSRLVPISLIRFHTLGLPFSKLNCSHRACQAIIIWLTSQGDGRTRSMEECCMTPSVPPTT